MTETRDKTGGVAVDREEIIRRLKEVRDPEIPVNLYDLGLIYDLAIEPDGKVGIVMTLTTPNCPVAGSLPEEVRRRVASVPGVKEAAVKLVWDPPWTPDRISEDGRLLLEMTSGMSFDGRLHMPRPIQLDIRKR